MAISIVHPFVSGKSDGSDSSKVQPSNWNAAHTITMATARILGRKTASTGAVEELTADDVYDLIGIIGTTRMVFQQTAAPTGWTKDTTHNNKAFRLVSGTVSTGGSSAFTTVFGSAVTSSSYALTTADIPAHTHGAGSYAVGTSITNGTSVARAPSNDDRDDEGGGSPTVASVTSATLSLASGAVSGTSASTGSDGGHTHTTTLAVQYVDFIIAEKD